MLNLFSPSKTHGMLRITPIYIYILLLPKVALYLFSRPMDEQAAQAILVNINPVARPPL